MLGENSIRREGPEPHPPRDPPQQGGADRLIEDLATALHDLLSVEAREKIGPPKIRHRVRRGRAKNLQPDEPAEDAALHLIRADAAVEETEEIDQIDAKVKPAG